MCIVKLALDRLFVHILRNGVIDVEQCDSILADAGADKLTQCAVNIYLAGYRNTSSGQTTVDIARNKSKLCLECRPALSSDCHILAVSSVCLNPIKKCQLILCKLWQNLWLLIAFAKFCFHLCYLSRDSWVIVMLLKCLKQIKLGVFLDLNTKVIQWLDRCITC